MALLEPEVAGQSAAAGIEPVDLGMGVLEQLPVVLPVVEGGVVVAVHLADDPNTLQVRRLPAGGVLGEQFGEGDGLVAQPGDVEVVGEQVRGVGAEHRGAGRFEAEDEAAAADVVGEGVDGAAQDLLGAVQLAGGDPGQPAADRLGGDGDRPAGVLEQADGGLSDVRVEVVGERVGPQQHGAAQTRSRAAAAQPPLLQRLAGEQRDLAVVQAGRAGREPWAAPERARAR